MKKNTQFCLIILIILITLSTLLSACTPAVQTATTPTATVPTASAPSTEESADLYPVVMETSIPEPTSTTEPTPTATPEPIPCTIAFDSDREGPRQIFLMDGAGQNLRNLTSDTFDNWNPSFSADGKQVAFVSFRETEQKSGKFIFVIYADGSDLRQLTTDTDSDFPDWSHDGLLITYTAGGDVWIIPADGSKEPLNLTNSPERDQFSTFSPDGTQIAWASSSDEGNSWNVFVMNTDGSNIRQITNNGQVSDVQWTVDGRLFTSWGWNDREQICQNCVIDANGTEVVDAGGKTELQRFLPFWTPAGDRVELANIDLIDGNYEIYLVGEVFPDLFLNLTNHPAKDDHATWPANCGPGGS
jgi:dipeptidyl aminopeptidase/acylaminoacyl peptidase